MNIWRGTIPRLILGILFPMSKCSLVAAWFLGLLLASAAAGGDTLLDVDAGWDGHLRSQRWAPIYVTASDRQTRNVVLTLNWPGGGGFLMHIRQNVTLDAQPRTFRLLAPVSGWSDQQASVTVTDADNGKLLAEYPKDASASVFNYSAYSPTSATLGVSGRATDLPTLSAALGQPIIGFLPPPRLPETAIGFDALDLLVLDGPNLSPASFGPAPLSDVQQQAIVDWVKGGGNLLLWPGETGFPTRGPLVDVLPAKVGERRNIALSRQDLFLIGLPDHFASISAYDLTPIGSAAMIGMFNRGQTSAATRRLGFGRIVLLPLDAGQLPIDDQNRCRRFWGPLAGPLLPTNEPAGMRSSLTDDPADQGERQAAMRVADYLGNIKGAGVFGFNYIVVALIVMMILVGPLDWFVLKRLGRQPWTWLTTAAWIALITLAAVFAGYLFKSGDLDFRTLRTIDQIDGETVGQTDFVSLYSPRTRVYDIKADPAGWFRPAAIDDDGFASQVTDEVNYHQTDEGNIPLPMVVNVWSLRFLRGDRVSSGPPMIAADLSPAEPADGRAATLAGTITNLSDRGLKNVRVLTRGGIFLCKFDGSLSASQAASQPAGSDTIAPGAAAKILSLRQPGSSDPPPQPVEGDHGMKPPRRSELYSWAAELNGRRSRMIQQLVDTGDYVCIYAESVDPAPAAELRQSGAHTEHLQFIRAVVKLRADAGKAP